MPGFAALAGLLAVPGGPAAPNALFAAAAAATVAAIVRVIGCCSILFAVLTCFAMTCLAAAIVCVVAAAPLPRTTASHRCTGREKPREAANSFGGLSIASRGMATSVSRSSISCGTVVLKRVIRVGIDEAIKTG